MASGIVHDKNRYEIGLLAEEAHFFFNKIDCLSLELNKISEDMAESEREDKNNDHLKLSLKKSEIESSIFYFQKQLKIVYSDLKFIKTKGKNLIFVNSSIPSIEDFNNILLELNHESAVHPSELNA